MVSLFLLSNDDGLTHAPVDDGAGNRNNLLKVNLKSHKDSLIDTHVMDQATANVQAPEETGHQAPEPSVPVPAQIRVTDEDCVQREASHEPEHQPAPETFPVQDDEKKAAVDTHITEDVTAPILEADHSTSKLDASADVPPTEQNLFPHETLRVGTSAATSDPAELEVQDDDDYEQISSPLFRHETMTPIHSHHEEEDTNIIPLFRHESMSPTDAHAPFFSGKSVRSNSATSHHSLHSHNSQNFNNYDIEDVNDPMLEKFPCERDGIFAQLQRTGSRVHRDAESAIEATPSSPALSSTRSLSAATSPSLARESSQNLDCIDEDEAEELSPAEAKDPAVGLGLDQTAPASAPGPEVNNTDAEPEKKDTTSKLSISPSHEPVNRGPLTPPLTPIDESQARSVAPDGKIDGKAQGSPSSLRKDNSTDHVTSRSKSSSSSASADGKAANSKPASFSTWISRMSGGRAGPLLVILPIIESVHIANISNRSIAFAVGALAVLYAVAGQNSAAKIHEVVL